MEFARVGIVCLPHNRKGTDMKWVLVILFLCIISLFVSLPLIIFCIIPPKMVLIPIAIAWVLILILLLDLLIDDIRELL